MSFEHDLEELRKVDPKYASNIDGLMSYDEIELPEGATLNQRFERFASAIGEGFIKTPFHLSSNLVPTFAATQGLAIRAFNEAHAPAYLDSIFALLHNSVGASQLALFHNPESILSLLEIREDQYGLATRWFGQYTVVGLARLMEDVKRKLGNSIRHSECAIRHLLRDFLHQQAEHGGMNASIQADDAGISPKAMARLLQLHCAQRSCGGTSPWRGAVIKPEMPEAFRQLASCVYGLDENLRVSLKAWTSCATSPLVTTLGRAISTYSYQGFDGGGVLSGNVGGSENPGYAGLIMDLVTTAQLMILKGDDPHKVIECLSLRGQVINELESKTQALEFSVAENLTKIALFPFRHLWKRFDLTSETYHGSRLHLEHFDSDVTEFMGRHTGEYGISGLLPIRAQEQIEMRYPETMPSYLFSQEPPASEVERIAEMLAGEIRSGMFLARTRFDEAIFFGNVQKGLGSDLMKAAIALAIEGKPDDYLHHGQIFHCKRSEFVVRCLGEFQDDDYEKVVQDLSELPDPQWLDEVFKARRPPLSLVAKLNGRVRETVLNQDLGL